MQIPDSLMVWLGPAAEELTAAQIECVVNEDRRLSERYPDPDEQREHEVALSATIQYLLGDTSAEEANRALVDARRREREAFVAAEQVAVMLHRDGTPEAAAARAVGIDRMSLRRALGKRT
jgi:hypothetical protein